MAYAPLSLYIHIPFCKQKCQYCDFPSYAGCEGEFEGYLSALTQELKQSATLCRDYEIPTVFIGGGTPTVLPPKMLGAVMDVVLNKYRLAPNAEITVEANPGTLDANYLAELKAMAVNRLSMGVQAWQGRLLTRLGRIHTKDQFVQNYMDAREIGFDNINVDLMFGLPGQSLNDWAETLENIVALSPDHISAYGLIVEEGTPFFEQQKEGKLPLPGEVMDRRMYALARDVLPRFGYHQYEISNFAKDEKECLHNKVYWQTREYLGLGLGAHSYVGWERFHNTYDLTKYIAARGDKRLLSEELQALSLEDRMAEFCFMGLRMTRGISFADFSERFGVSIEEIYGEPMKKLKEQGLLRRTEDGVALTHRGMDVSNQVFVEFIIEKQ